MSRPLKKNRKENFEKNPYLNKVLKRWQARRTVEKASNDSFRHKLNFTISPVVNEIQMKMNNADSIGYRMNRWSVVILFSNRCWRTKTSNLNVFLTQVNVFCVLSLDNRPFEFDIVNQRRQWLLRTSLDVFHQEFHFDTTNKYMWKWNQNIFLSFYLNVK